MASDTLTLNVQGMTCAGCAARVERALSALPETDRVHVNVATGKAYISGTNTPLDAAITAITALGYSAERVSGVVTDKTDTETQTAKRRALLAIALTLPVFVSEMGGHIWPPFHHWQMALVGHWSLWFLQFLLTSIVLFWPGLQFFRVGLPLLFKGAPNMDSLVALGSLSAWGYSSVVLFLPDLIPDSALHVYFEAAAVIVSLILLGRWLEIRARAQARGAMTQLLGDMPDTTFVMKNGTPTEVPVAALSVADHVFLKPGARVPVDGVIVEGESDLDESMLSGEAIPVPKRVGDQVSAGTINGAGTVTFEATGVGEETLLARIVRTVEEAQANKAPIQSLVDRVVAVFVPVVIAIALATFAIWYAIGPTPTLPNAIVAMVSVLIIACPCAMGLAIPTSIMVASGRGAALGLLFTKGDALQRLSEVNTVAFDKTGTLTQGTPKITKIHTIGEVDEQTALNLAAAIEAGSEHPIAKAFASAAEGISLPKAESIKAHVGLGVTAVIDEDQLSLGSLDFVTAQGIDLTEFDATIKNSETTGATLIFLAKGQQAIALFALEDQVRPEAIALINDLNTQGLRTALISGDREPTAQRVAQQLGISEVHANVRPIEKADHIRALQERGTVAFVGDGINDAPALTQADVGIAMGEGTDVAMESADVVLMRSNLSMVAQAKALSEATLKNIRQNLFWAFGYNILLIPVAAGLFYPWLGWQLSPMLGAGAMALSSLFVVSNALRLRRFSAS